MIDFPQLGGPVIAGATALLGGGSCAIAACTDLRTRRVPNWLTFPTLGLALVLVSLQGVASLERSLLVVLGAFVLGAFLHASGLLGGGDVKLLIAIAALVGFPNCVALVLYTAVAGGVLAIGVSVVQRRLPEVMSKTSSALTAMWISKRVAIDRAPGAARAKDRLPYAVAIAAGFAVLVLSKTYFPGLEIPL
jgi:prepilin peptidase CpaA